MDNGGGAGSAVEGWVRSHSFELWEMLSIGQKSEMERLDNHMPSDINGRT